MKKVISAFLWIVIVFSCFAINAGAINEENKNPVIDFSITSGLNILESSENEQNRASGLITSTSLSISKSGTTLKITGKTLCVPDVVRCGFKNLTVERRLNSSSSWEDYYEYGNIYIDEVAAYLSTSLTVQPGYQYRVTTKHYAKKSLLVTQTISNESNYLTF